MFWLCLHLALIDELREVFGLIELQNVKFIFFSDAFW